MLRSASARLRQAPLQLDASACLPGAAWRRVLRRGGCAFACGPSCAQPVFARASQGLTPSRQPVDAHAHSMHKRAWQHAVAMVTGLRGLPVVVAATSASSVPARMKSCVTAKHCLALTTSSTSPAASSCARGDDNRDGSLAGPWLWAALCTRRDEASLKRRTGNIPSRPFGYDQV